MNNVTPSHAGKYQVVFHNKASNSYLSSRWATVTVTGVTGVAPTILGGPGTSPATVGAPAAISVIAKGDEPLSYQWYKNGIPVRGSGPQLWWDRVSLTDFGRYHVIVSNPFGAVVSTSILLDIRPPPEVVLLVRDGQGIKATVRSIEGRPFLVYRSSNLKTWASSTQVWNITGLQKVSIPVGPEQSGFFRLQQQ
ncbi:MAG: immunoglobulin domain-containing protein [Verrucomicrobiales bacterium]|nr:immunoglobulin domain-containing protein [Verrucomicrobiales bacterium]